MNDAISINVPIPAEFEQMKKGAPVLLAAAREFKCETQQDYFFAAGELKKVKSRRDALDALRKSLTRPVDEAKARIMDLFKPALSIYDEMEQLYKRSLLTYQDEQERIRREAQAKLDEAARKERERLETEARKAAEKGKTEKAEALQQRAAGTVAPVVAAPVAQAKGISTKTTWRAECFDVVELCKAIAAGKVAPIAVEPNMTFLNQQARSLEDHFSIPGCKAVPEKGIAASKRG